MNENLKKIIGTDEEVIQPLQAAVAYLYLKSSGVHEEDADKAADQLDDLVTTLEALTFPQAFSHQDIQLLCVAVGTGHIEDDLQAKIDRLEAAQKKAQKLVAKYKVEESDDGEK